MADITKEMISSLRKMFDVEGYNFSPFMWRKIEAALSSPSIIAQPKPLEWTAEDNGDFIAQCVVGWYHVGLPASYWSTLTPTGEILSGFESPTDAKSAAQAHFDAAILSARTLAEKAPDSEIIEALLANEPFVFDPATNFMHADDGGAPEHGIKYVPAPAEKAGVGDGDAALIERCAKIAENNAYQPPYSQRMLDVASSIRALSTTKTEAVDADAVIEQNEWLKDRLSDLQLPANSHKNIEEWLVECGMPTEARS